MNEDKEEEKKAKTVKNKITNKGQSPKDIAINISITDNTVNNNISNGVEDFDSESFKDRREEGGSENRLVRWPEEVRGTPRQMVRSSLFSATAAEQNKGMVRALIAAQNGYEIRYTGVRLGQPERAVYEQLLHRQRLVPLGELIIFTAYDLLTSLGRGTANHQYQQLRNELAKLTGAVEIRDVFQQRRYMGGMLELWVHDETSEVAVRFNPQLKCLFDIGWVGLEIEVRKKLARKVLAQWLYGMVASHQQVPNMTVEQYIDLSGSKTSNPRSFKQKLKKAFNVLEDLKVITDYSIDKDNLVMVQKAA